MLPTRNSKVKGTDRLKRKKLRKMYQKKAGVAILISDKAVFRTWKVIRESEEHYIMLKGSIILQDIIIKYVCILQ